MNLEQDLEEISFLFPGEYKYKRIQHCRSYHAETLTLVKINCTCFPCQENGPGIAVDEFLASLKKFATNSFAVLIRVDN